MDYTVRYLPQKEQIQCPTCQAELKVERKNSVVFCPVCNSALQLSVKRVPRQSPILQESKQETVVDTIQSEESKRKSKRIAKAKKTGFLAIKWFFLLLLSVFFLFPIYALVVNSFIPPEQTLDKLWPNRFTFQAYTDMFTIEYFNYLKNTIFVCGMNILGTCFGASLCAYGLSKVRFKGKNVVFMIIMATVLLPGTVTSIPLYIIYNNLGWTGTLYPLWVPIWLGGGAMNIFLVRQFMKGIPNSYSEAAILDGARSFHIYYAIVLPLIRPILVYLAVTTFFGCWNDYTGPLMYVADKQSSWTLSLALYKDFVVPESTKVKYVSSQMAVGVMMMIPCVILFAFFQRELMEGIAAIGIKG